MVTGRPGDTAETPPWTLTLDRAGKSTSEWLTTLLLLVVND